MFKLITFVNDASRVTLRIVASLLEHNRTAHIRHLSKKTSILSCHRFLIKTGVEKMNYI